MSDTALEVTPEELTELEEGTNVPAKVQQPQEDMVVHSGFDIASLLPSAGRLMLSPPQKEILYKPIDENAIEIRPDGLIYANWTEYQNRLIGAFGLEWCMIPEGNTGIKDNLVYRKYHLVIQGVYMTDAVGCQEYQSTNRTMNYGDAVEGARSNAMMRCCKHIGMTPELWQPSFIREWIAKYAETYPNPHKPGKVLWRKKKVANKPEIPSRTQEKAPRKPSEPRSQETNPPVPVEDITPTEEVFLRQNLLDELPKLIDASTYDKKRMKKPMKEMTTKELVAFKEYVLTLIDPEMMEELNNGTV